MTRSRALAFLLTLAGACLGLAAPAAAADVIGKGTDPAGDAPAPGVDIVAFEVSYDAFYGVYDAEVRLRGTPDPALRGLISVSLGPRQGSACGFPSTSVSSINVERTAFWATADSPTDDPDFADADQTGSGTAVQTFSAASSRLADRPADCAQAAVLVPGAGAQTYDVTAPVVVREPPAPKLAIKVRDAKRGIKVTVSNRGEAPAREVTVRFGDALGLRYVPRRKSLRTIPVGRRKASVFRVVVGSSVRRVTKLALSATARGGFRTFGTLTVRLKGPLPKRPRRTNGGGGGTDPLRFGTCLGGGFTLIPCLL